MAQELAVGDRDARMAVATPAGSAAAVAVAPSGVQPALAPTRDETASSAPGTRISLEIALYLLLGLLAVLMRFWDLGSRAQHHDESLHSYFSWLYYTGAGYRHDPLMHGPFLFHVAALSYFLFGDSDATSRYAPALFGAATVVLPFLLRRELGRWGALIASLMLLVSPSFLYFGRFHRHDVYSAFFTLLLFCAIVRFFATHRPAWIFTGAAAWGFLFTNKEDLFIVTAIFGSALGIAVLWRVARRVLWLGVGLLVALGIVVKVLPRALGWPGLPPIPWQNPTNEAIRAYVAGLLTHPIVLAALLAIAAFLVVAVSWLGRVAGEEGWVDGLFGHDEPGTPVAGVHALLRDPATLWTAAGVAVAIYMVLYTSLFTNIPGLFSGSFGAIGYWLGQQNVQRAEQPWFYYLLLLPQYDPLAALVGGCGVVLTGWRIVRAQFGWGAAGPQPFARGFIAYWAVASIGIYSWAGEKMPWMVIHLVLPLTLLAAAVLGGAVEGLLARRAGAAPVPDEAGTGSATGNGREYEAGVAGVENVDETPAVRQVSVTTRGARRLAGGAGSLQRDLVAGGLIVAAVVAWFLGMARLSAGAVVGVSWWLLLVPALAIAAVATGYALLSTWRRAGRVALLALASALLLFQVHAGWVLAFERGDVPLDMLVYVQTSPDVTRFMEELDLFSAELTGGKDLALMYDSNTSWPFQWYLRDYRYKQYFDQTLAEPPGDEVAIVLVGAENLAARPELAGMLANYVAQPYSMRWHFPEDETYRLFALAPELSPARNAWSPERPPYTLPKVLRSIASSLTATAEPANQARLFRLLAYRQLWAPLGSYDFTVYVRRDLLPQYNAIRYR